MAIKTLIPKEVSGEALADEFQLPNLGKHAQMGKVMMWVMGLMIGVIGLRIIDQLLNFTFVDALANTMKGYFIPIVIMVLLAGTATVLYVRGRR